MTKILFFVTFAKKLKNLMVLWRFNTMLDLAEILQGVILGKNATFPHSTILFSQTFFFWLNSTRPI